MPISTGVRTRDTSVPPPSSFAMALSTADGGTRFSRLLRFPVLDILSGINKFHTCEQKSELELD